MRPLFLTLNGQAVDLPTSTKGLVKLTQARAALADISARVGEYSASLTLPTTRRNATVFGVDRLHELGLNKFGPYADFAYELRCEGQVFTGTFRLTSLKNGYTGSLIGAGLSWALLLGDRKLTDLVFPTVVYDGDQLESILALDCDRTDLQFPLVAYGNFFHPPLVQVQADGTSEEVPCPPAAVLDYPLSVDDYPPGVYYVNVLRAIFASIGWQLQGRELDSDFWRAVVMLPAGADLDRAWPWGALLPAQASGSGVDAFSYYQAGPGDGFTTSPGAGLVPLAADELDVGTSGELFFLPVALGQVGHAPTRALAGEAATYTAPREGVYRFTWSAVLNSGHQSIDGVYMGGLIDRHLRPVGVGLVVRRSGQDFSGGDGGLLTDVPPLVSDPFNYTVGQDRVLAPDRLDVPTGSLTDLAFGAHGGVTGDVYLAAGDAVTLAVFAVRFLKNNYNEVMGSREEFVLHFSTAALACTYYADNDGISKTLVQPADFLPPLGQRELVREFLVRTNSFIVANDPGRRIATLMSRAEMSGGEPLDISALCDPRQVEYLPAAGTTGSFVFSPATLSDDPLMSEAADVVTATVGPDYGQQQVSSLFAPVGFRAVYFANGLTPALPTCSTKDGLQTARSEAQQQPGDQAPRLLRYLGTDANQPVPFAQRTVPLARAAWDGVLAWDGEAGAVGAYYADVLRRAITGHLARVQMNLSPTLYASLKLGRRVLLTGGLYSVAALSNFDPSDEAGVVTLDLVREVL